MVGRDVYLKLENQQLTGSFKVRGALNMVSTLSDEERARGIIASSAGNHAKGVALAASRLKTRATIVMPRYASIVKVEATRSYGVNVILHGEAYDEAYELAQQLQAKEGFHFVHPFRDPPVIAGQGTIGLEIFEDLPDVDTVVVPVGGGGLISGIAVALKTLNPKIRIIGVQARAANSMVRSFRAKDIVTDIGRVATIADGVAVKKPSEEMLRRYLTTYVDDMVDVTEDEIAEAIVFLMERGKLVVEGAGALALAALRTLKEQLGQKVVLILSGGNVDLNILKKVIHRGLLQWGRLVEFQVEVEDRPGVLNEITAILAQQGCNVMEVHHDRNRLGLEFGGTRIDFVVETAGPDATKRVWDELVSRGYRLEAT